MPYHEVFITDFIVPLENKLLPHLKKKRGGVDGCFPRNTVAVRATLRFHIPAFFHTNSDPMCLSREREKCFLVNYIHVQSRKAKLHVLVA